MSFQESGRPSEEDEAFYAQCRAAYLAVLRSSLTNITSKQQLCRGKLTNIGKEIILLYVCYLTACSSRCTVHFIRSWFYSFSIHFKH